MATETNAIYSMTSELNHPDCTENSPMTRPAITLKGVLSILGVFSAARRRPSMAISRRRSWKIRGIFTVSFTATKENTLGSQFRFCINRRNTGVRNTVIRVISALATFR